MEELSTDIKKVSGNISEIMQEIEQSEQIIGNGYGKDHEQAVGGY